MNKICYFSQMYQAIPSLIEVQNELGGLFVCGRGSTTRYFRKEHPTLGFARFSKRFKGFSAGHKAMLGAKCIVTGSPYKSLLSPYSAKKLMVFHGTYAGMSNETLNGLKHFDHLCLIGPRMEKMLKRYQDNYSFDYSLTGFIPFQSFPDKSDIEKRNVINKLGLDVSLKTVLFCPSRKGEGSWGLIAEKLIKEIPENFNLILRPHPSLSMNIRWYEKKEFKRIKELVEQRKNTLLDKVNFKLPSLLMASDLLISDANSPSEEALYYDTPQLLTGLGNSSYKVIKDIWVAWKMHEEDIEERLRLFSCGPVFSDDSYDNWGEAVEYAISNEKKYSSNRQNCFESIFGQRDKQAGHRVAEIIKSKYL